MVPKDIPYDFVDIVLKIPITSVWKVHLASNLLSEINIIFISNGGPVKMLAKKYGRKTPVTQVT